MMKPHWRLDHIDIHDMRRPLQRLETWAEAMAAAEAIIKVASSKGIDTTITIFSPDQTRLVTWQTGVGWYWRSEESDPWLKDWA